MHREKNENAEKPKLQKDAQSKGQPHWAGSLRPGLQEGPGSATACQGLEVGDGLCFLLQLYLAIHYSIWRPKNSDITLVFVWLT